MLGLVLVLLGYWLILFVACYIIVEYAQGYLYDETTPSAPLKVGIGSFLLAALLTYFRTRYDTMLTSDLRWSVLQIIAWFVVFTLILRFHPVHALVIGAVAFLIVSGAASLAIDSLSGSNPSGAPASRKPAQPLKRRAVGPTLDSLPKAEDAPREEPAKAKP
jgi:hypothetical protein